MSVYYILLSHITIWWHSGRLIYYMIGQASCLMAAISLNHWPSSCTCGVCSVLWCLNLLLPINLQVYPYNGRSPKLVHFGDMEVPSDFRTSHLYTSHCSITFVDAETLCFHSLVHVGSTIAWKLLALGLGCSSDAHCWALGLLLGWGMDGGYSIAK